MGGKVDITINSGSKQTLPWIIIVLLSIGLIYFIWDEYNDYLNKPDVIVIDKVIRDTSYLPGEVIVKTIKGDSIYYDVDTMAIINDYIENNGFVIDTPKNEKDSFYQELFDKYSTLKIYGDTIELVDISDSSYIAINDSIRYNRILSRRYEYRVDSILIRDTSYVKIEPKDELYYGFSSNLNRTNIVSYLGIGLAYRRKNNNIYILNTGVGMNGEFVVNIGGYFKFK